MRNQLFGEHKSSIYDIDANLVALFCYLGVLILRVVPIVGRLAWLAPLVIYFVEKNSDFVRFHALQAFLFNLVKMIFIRIVVTFIGILGFLNFLGGQSPEAMRNMIADDLNYVSPVAFMTTSTVLIFAVSGIISLIFFIVAIKAMIGSYNYKTTYIPFIGEFVSKINKKL